MIYTVTFNPAIDYVVRLDRPLEVGEVNRAAGEDCVLGGKGINVSGVLRELGCESILSTAFYCLSQIQTFYFTAALALS